MTSKAKVAKATASRRGIERDILGEYIHTAMRKICDSDASSLAYNVIHLCKEGWTAYLDLVWDELRSKKPLWQCARDAARHLDYGSAERNALRLSFALMNQADWESAVSFLEDDAT